MVLVRHKISPELVGGKPGLTVPQSTPKAVEAYPTGKWRTAHLVSASESFQSQRLRLPVMRLATHQLLISYLFFG